MEENMNITICDNYDEMSIETAKFIINYLKNRQNPLVCFAAGDTPVSTYKCLVESARRGLVEFKGIKFVGLDEWVGMSEKDEGSCRNFLNKTLFEPLFINRSNIIFFDACSEDLEGECRKVDDYIRQNGPIDLMLIGIGVNGHIGLNEPGTPFDSCSHVVELTSLTKRVAQKYFNEKKELDKGITLGMKHVMEANCVILIASGTKKARIIKEAVEGNITNDIPASLLQLHKNCYLFLDKEAASMLNKN